MPRMNLSNWPDAIYMILYTILFMLGMYLGVGVRLLFKFHKGIKKNWLDRDGPKHHVFWSYLIGLLFWPWVDWEHLEVETNWMMLIEAEEKVRAYEEKERN